MKIYTIYDLTHKKYYAYGTHQRRYAVLAKFVNQGYLVEQFYDKDNIKQYIVKKCHE